MHERKITISTKEYNYLIGLAGLDKRITMFEEYVNSQSYSIDKEICAIYLGFEITKGEEDAISN